MGKLNLISGTIVIISIIIMFNAIPLQVVSDTFTNAEMKVLESEPLTMQNNVEIDKSLTLDFTGSGQALSAPVFIYLLAGTFDPLSIPELQTLTISKSNPSDHGYYIIQFTGPIRSEWRATLETRDVTIQGYIPDYAYLVGSNFESLIEINELPYIRWIGEYKPDYKIAPRIRQRLDSIQEAQELNFGSSELTLEITEFENKHILKVPLNELELVAAEFPKSPEVVWLDIAPNYRIFNDRAAGIINATGIWRDYGLNGSGQIITVCDTGLDTGNLVTLHADFLGRNIKTYTLGRPGDWSDDNIHTPFPDLAPVGGHGTHVAGSAVGNGANSGGGGTCKGIAYGADLVFQSTMTISGDLAIPGNLNDLFSPPYNNDGSRVHTNSWGDPMTNGEYTSNSAEIDEFVWNNPEMVILSSAGNYNAGITTLVSAPATAKNCITVGASESYRPELPLYGNECDDPDELAAFSLPGPCSDGRLKPDIVAPGTGILSTRSTLVEDDHYPWGVPSTPLDSYYAYDGGTSMSTPITAGATAIIRQFYSENELHNPSAALVKAALLNGAVDMLASSGTPPVPNYEEGWGRINLSESLFPPAPKHMRYEDNSTGLTTAKNYTFQYDVTDTSVPLKLTLVWSDYPSTTSASINLVNDLNLIVTAPDGETAYKGNVFKNGGSSSNDNDANSTFDKDGDGYDEINNVECVYIDTPAVGRYTVTIIGHNTPMGPQPFAFVVTGGVDLAEILPPIDLTVTEIPEGNALNLSWIPCLSSDMVGYRIYRNDSSSLTEDDLIVELEDRNIETYYDPNLEDGEKYYYSLRAVDKYNQTSSYSNLASGVPRDSQEPVLQVISPTSGEVVGGNVTVEYINCSDTVEVRFKYYIDTNSDGLVNDNNNWHNIGTDLDLTDYEFGWNTTNKTKGGAGPGDAECVILNVTAMDESWNNCTVPVTNLTVDNTAPHPPELYNIVPNPTNRSSILVSGKSELSATVRIYVNDALKAEALAMSAGIFNIAVDLDEGVNYITSRAFDIAGNGPSAPSHAQAVIRDTKPPVAAAGPNRTVPEGTSVVLNGSGSYDTSPVPEYNYISEYVWSFKLFDGTPVILYGVCPTYYFDTIGNYTVTLMVADAAGNWAKDSIWLLVRDSSVPTAYAGPDLEIDEDTEVTFNGNKSVDNDPLFDTTGNFTWTFEDYIYQTGKFELKQVTLYGVTVKYLFCTPGEYIVTLTVTDSGDNSDTDMLLVRVRDLTPPLANAGDDETIQEGRTVIFNCSRSTDNDPHFYATANFTWRFVYNNKSRVFYGLTFSFRFKISKPQPYKINLTVRDAAGNPGQDEIRIHVLDDILLPRITAVSPLDSAMDIPIDTTITVTFNEELDTATIYPPETNTNTNTTSAESLLYSEPINIYDIHNNQISGTIEYDPATITITFTPTSTPSGQLVFNNGYTVIVTSHLTDLAGNPLDGNRNSYLDIPPGDDFSWVFTTISITTTPSFEQEMVAVDTGITASFSGNISNLTIANSYITLKDQAGNQIEGECYFENATLLVGFKPDPVLRSDEEYTVTFSILVFPLELTADELDGSNLSGKYIHSNLTWSFVTVSSDAGDENEGGESAILLLWIICLVIIVCIIIAILIFVKRSSRQLEQEPVEREGDAAVVVDEDWSAAAVESESVTIEEPGPKHRRKKRRNVIEWDDDQPPEDWKPPVVEWGAEQKTSHKNVEPRKSKLKPKKSKGRKRHAQKRKRSQKRARTNRKP